MKNTATNLNDLKKLKTDLEDFIKIFGNQLNNPESLKEWQKDDLEYFGDVRETPKRMLDKVYNVIDCDISIIEESINKVEIPIIQ